MSKSKIKMLILGIYFTSLAIFESIGSRFASIDYTVGEGRAVLFTIFSAPLLASIIHFILVSVIAVAVIFIKQINKEYKNIIYFFPLLTFIFSFPMLILVSEIESWFRFLFNF